MTREKRDVWVKRVERWRDSGLTAKAFADEVGISADRLRYWKWKLSRPESSTTTEASPLPTGVTPLPFVEVTTCGGSEHKCDDLDERIEIVVRSGACIRVPARFDEAALRRVLALVK